jgi:hypothetical protein
MSHLTLDYNLYSVYLNAMIKHLLAIAAVGLFAVTPAQAQNRPSDGTTYGPGTKFEISPFASVKGVVRVTRLGAPIAASANRIVTSTNMQNAAYTIAAQPDVPRNITVTQTAAGTTDTSGTVTVVGTDIGGNALTEVITPVAGSAVAGVNAFAHVTSVTGAGWAENMASTATIDTITVGVGNLIGLPVSIQGAPTIVLSGGGPAATGAAFTVTVTNGAVASVAVVTGGTGFTSVPSVLFSNVGTGVGATAHAVVSNGAITSVVVDTGGTLYRGNAGTVLATVGTSVTVGATTAGSLPLSTVDAHSATYSSSSQVLVYGDL